MNPVFFAKVTFGHLTYEQVVHAYRGWTLGVGHYAHIRSRRLDLGLPSSLTPESLSQGGSFRGDHDCEITTRSSDNVFLLRFVHRDSDDSGLLWHTAARVARAPLGCCVEHGVNRSAGRGAVLPPVAATPVVFARLLERNGHKVQPRDLWETSRLVVDEEGADDFVPHILADDQRQMPYLVVTPTNEDDRHLVSPERLAKALCGLARVISIPTRAAAFRLTRALKTRGFPNEFGVSNGSLRLFQPCLRPDQSPWQHYLWPRRRIESVPEERRLEHIAGEVAARIVGSSLPIGFFELIEDFDRLERRRMATTILEASLSPVAEAGPDVRAVLSERDKRIGELEQALLLANKDLEEIQDLGNAEACARRQAEETYRHLEQAADEARDRFEYELEARDARLREREERLSELKTRRAADSMPSEAREAVEAVLDGKPTPEQCLLAAMALYPSRLHVLPQALKAARRARDSTKGREAFQLLRKLATDYWEALQGGKGDSRARSVFGVNEYAAQESETVENSSRARAARTFAYKERQLVMEKHLKVGWKRSATETLRIHFEWIAEERVIVVGHCGEHLPFR
jgi:hypothetical protein